MKSTPSAIALRGPSCVTALFSVLSLSAVAWFAPTTSQAQVAPDTVLYTTNFVGTNGSVPADWETFTAGDNTLNIQSDRFVFTRVNNGTPLFGLYNGSYDTGSGMLSTDEWTNYRVDTVFRSTTIANSATVNGVVVRWQEGTGLSGEQKGYLGIITYVNATTLRLNIVRDFANSGTGSNFVGANGTSLVSQDFTFSLANNTDYRLSFTAAGSSLTFEFMTIDNETSFSVSATDATYASGGAALRTYHSSNSRSTSWDQFTVTTVIPEPGTYGLLLGVIVLGAVAARRRGRA